jgi:hypothetical protein
MVIVRTNDTETVRDGRWRPAGERLGAPGGNVLRCAHNAMANDGQATHHHVAVSEGLAATPPLPDVGLYLDLGQGAVLLFIRTQKTSSSLMRA